MSRQRAVVVELVGPAGAGKTTLAQGVSAADATVRSGLSLWGLPRRRLIRSAIALRSVVDDEVANHRVIILDEGPVFALSWLEVFFSRNGDRVPAAWRRRVVAEWARLLDVVVFIDASDITLADRIRTREKPHMVKGLPDEEIFGFSAGFRRAFERAIGELAQAGHIVVDTLKTDTGPVDENTAQLMTKLQKRRNGH